jgi:hypothetical protein
MDAWILGISYMKDNCTHTRSEGSTTITIPLIRPTIYDNNLEESVNDGFSHLA